MEHVCALCGLSVKNIRSGSTAVRVEGWVTNRSGGGTNHLRYQRKTGEVAHLTCLDEQEVPAKYQMEKLFP